MNNEPNHVPATDSKLPPLDTQFHGIEAALGGWDINPRERYPYELACRERQFREVLSELASVRHTNLMLQEEVRCGMIELERAERRARERDRLRAALERWKAHVEPCDYASGFGGVNLHCACGFYDAHQLLAALAPPADRVTAEEGR